MEIKEEVEGRGKRVGTISVPDFRVDELSKKYKPKKTTYSTLQIEELEGSLESSKELATVLGNLRQVDALCLVLGAFQSPDNSPLPELNAMLDELKIADLVLIEKRIERLEREGAKGKEIEGLRKFKQHLEDADGLLKELETDEDEQQLFSGFRFLTQKPIIALVNQSEEHFMKKEYADLVDFCKSKKIALLEICAPLEWELSQLEPDEQAAFLEDLGIKEAAIGRFIRTCYEMVNYISFFTVGPDEVRAWTITKEDPAVIAAGKIHSDIQRGFIRAEVMAYSDLIEVGSEAELKSQGKFYQQGKEYAVQDGDIINFKFNV